VAYITQCICLLFRYTWKYKQQLTNYYAFFYFVVCHKHETNTLTDTWKDFSSRQYSQYCSLIYVWIYVQGVSSGIFHISGERSL